jgi:hypothetical protein
VISSAAAVIAQKAMSKTRIEKVILAGETSQHTVNVLINDAIIRAFSPAVSRKQRLFPAISAPKLLNRRLISLLGAHYHK